MEGFEVRYVDYCWGRCKNFQRINTVEMFYYVDTEGSFSIEINFHKIDFEIWEQIFEIQQENVEGITFENNRGKKIDKPVKGEDYYSFVVNSKDWNLYRNINLIMYLKKDEWDNMNEMLKLNTIDGGI